MEGFLQRCSAALKGSSEGSSGIHVVLGNEACDLDSMVSSLAFAYFLSTTSGSSCKTVVPVLNIPRAEFPLRLDNVFLLKESGVPSEALVFRDEVDLAGLHRAKRLVLSLVDHNVLPSADIDLEEAVVEVIDHHHLERTPSTSCSVTNGIVGSCATLVTEYIHHKAPEVLDRQVAQLLYGAIVLDCVNMAPEAGKVTSKDSLLACLLESRFPDLPPRGALFQSLQSAKFDISGLSTEQILLKDMKAVSEGDLRLAVSTVYMTLDMFLQRKSLQRELCEFCHKHRFGAVVAMTISFNERSEPHRQLAVYSSSTLYREEVSQALEKARNPSLCISPMSSPFNDIKSYLQGNALASRKKVLPILKDFLKEWDKKQVHCRETEDFEELDNHFDPTGSPGIDGDSRPHCFSASRHHRRRLLGAEDSGMEEDFQVPATPMNSLVEGCPLDAGLPQISAEAILEKFSCMVGEAGGNKDVSWPGDQ
ncbi:exopolyphosphatase PRUNE1-like [Oncorhynchus tshawytscha]|uniref:DHHA2 domain-containing protein n=1 Tax=Oncorhynchus tshawytscha TaxID=74940 RepID=A0AAZ3SDY2_ONCTS|nr:exopolyphosphatase PRUNE1-like [Oncorhynchus tshawytscha]